MPDREFFIFTCFLALTAVLGIALLSGAFTTSLEDVVRTTTSAGYHDIVPGTWRYGVCARPDKIGREFTARADIDTTIKGIVCCTARGSCAIRFSLR